MGDDLYLDIAFGLNVDTTFQYRCPPEWAERALPGMRVLAPLRGRPTAGVIVSVGGEAKVGRVLSILSFPDDEPLLPPPLMETIGWVAGRYLSTVGMVFKSAVPAAVLRSGKLGEVPETGRRLFAEPRPLPATGPSPTPGQRMILDLLAAEGPQPAARLIESAGSNYRTLRLLEQRGFLRLVPRFPEPASAPLPEPSEPVTLTGEQVVARDEVARALAGPSCRKILLQGPPGSGKMEAFLQALAAGLPPDRQALILVPEVSLTPPLTARLESFFPGRTAVFHHRLPEGQKVAVWSRCRRGDVRVVLGSRSAVFLPLPRLGVILVDEEQEPSYKAEETPRYHAREVAGERGRREGIPVVMTSAAPSLETVVSLTEPGTVSLTLAPPPGLRGTLKLTVVDLGAEKGRGERILSGQLLFALRETLRRKHKAILFVNRRGTAAAAFCADCFYTPRCPHCSVPLGLPAGEDSFACRVCGHRQPVFQICPRCGGSRLRMGSPGTRGVEREVLRHFPGTPTAVFDRDTTTRKGELERIIDDFTRGPLQVLIGTQLLARGHHWPAVAMVGVIDADTPLHRPDFRSAERTYQLLTQVAGLAGWGLPRGRVIIQTHYPDHYALEAVERGDPQIFYRQELALRREVGFPPFAGLVLLTLEGVESGPLDVLAGRLRVQLEEETAIRGDGAPGGMEILGPHAASQRHRTRRHRRQILVKGPSPEAVREMVRRALRAFSSPRGAAFKLTVDVDPVDFL